MLNPRQTHFVSIYLQWGNATEAYKMAYGIQDDMQAAANASRLIRNDKVKRAISEFKQEIMLNTTITIESTVGRINELASTAEKDADKLKALDMLMKHLGGYITLNEIIDKLSAEQLEGVSKGLLIKMGKDEK